VNSVVLQRVDGAFHLLFIQPIGHSAVEGRRRKAADAAKEGIC
jgi:hypothetical protein